MNTAKSVESKAQANPAPQAAALGDAGRGRHWGLLRPESTEVEARPGKLLRSSEHRAIVKSWLTERASEITDALTQAPSSF